jgi:hypothetical protein
LTYARNAFKINYGHKPVKPANIGECKKAPAKMPEQSASRIRKQP